MRFLVSFSTDNTIKADNHIIAHTDVGSITIKEAKEQHTRSEVHKEKNLDLTLGVKTGNGGVAVTIARARIEWVFGTTNPV